MLFRSPLAVAYDGSSGASEHGFQAHVGPMRSRSRGWVRLRSTDPAEPPRILFNYLSEPDDLLEMRACVRLTREIFAQPAFDRYRGREIQPGDGVQSDAEIDAFVRRHVESAYHPCGTCRMGDEQDAMAVRREDETSPVVVWTAQASFVDARLLTGESGWGRVGRDMAEPARTDVEAAVGSSLSGYVFAARVAPDPVSLARSVLAVASDITQSESSSGELTVSVVVDGSVGELEGLEAGSIPDLRFRIVDGRIASVGARLPSGEEDSFGFVWEYNGVSGVAEVVPPLVATDVEDVVALIGSGDRGQNDCEL